MFSCLGPGLRNSTPERPGFPLILESYKPLKKNYIGTRLTPKTELHRNLLNPKKELHRNLINPNKRTTYFCGSGCLDGVCSYRSMGLRVLPKGS